MRPYKLVVFAGTFDRLHEGHKHLLRIALKMGDAVRIGLTTDKMLEGKESRTKISQYSDREAILREFLESEDQSTRCEVFPIDTVEGGADTMAEIEALIVSDEPSVIDNALRINNLRLQRGLKRFHIIIVPRVLTADRTPISSSRERRGEKAATYRLTY